MIKAKYYVVEPYYMDDSTPDQLANFVIEPEFERSPVQSIVCYSFYKESNYNKVEMNYCYNIL